MHENPEQVTYFAEADFRNRHTRFGIKAKDRAQHVYTIGKTGMGKSTMLENMAIQDIQNGNGVGFIDPHGSAVDKLIDYVPEERIQDVIYFAPFDVDNPVSFNVLENVGKDKRNLVANGLMSVFKKLWVDQWSARMEYFLINTLLALLEYPGATIMDINRMLVNKDFRKDVVSKVTDPAVKSFWLDEFATYTDTYAREATPAIQNKIGQFVSNPIIRNIVGQPRSSFNMRDVIDGKKILLMNLSKGRIGEENAKLIGGMLVVKIYLAALSRADLTSAELQEKPPFYFFVDEFQSFANESFADILSEARKYKLSLTIAHQYVEQMPETVRDAVFGNVGTMIVFRVGSFDAETFEKEFAPQFTAEDIVNLDARQVYLKLMIDGVSSRPFSAVTIPPIEPLAQSHREQVIAESRKQYAYSIDEVEKAVQKRMEEFPMQERSKEEADRARFKPNTSSRFGEKRDAPKPARASAKQASERPSTARAETPPKLKEERALRAPEHQPTRAPHREQRQPMPKREPRPVKNPDGLPPEESKNQLRDALAMALKEKQQHGTNTRMSPSTTQVGTGRGANDTNGSNDTEQERARPEQENRQKPEQKAEEKPADSPRAKSREKPVEQQKNKKETKEVPEETLRDILD